MPIVINELVFKGTIMDSKRDKKDAGEPDRRSREYDKRLVEICVEEVLKVLERQKER